MITSNVRKLMEDKGITVRAMVAGAGLSDKTILKARCERINGCRLYTLEAIAKFLKCKTKDLYEES
jgi:DNA-binding Xre family transcriptional regulator